jgi:hypothetical protein
VTNFGDFLLIYRAEIVDRAAPKLCPVVVTFAFGYLATNELMAAWISLSTDL